MIFHNNRWEVRIRYQGRKLYLGRYDDSIRAAMIYDGAARMLYQDFAGINFPDQPTPPHIEQIVIQRLLAKVVLVQPQAA